MIDISVDFEKSMNEKAVEKAVKREEKLVFNKKMNASMSGRFLIKKCAEIMADDVEIWLKDVQTKKRVAFNKKYSVKLFDGDELILNGNELSLIATVNILNVLSTSEETTSEHICMQIGNALNNELLFKHFEKYHINYLNKVKKNIEKEQKLKNIMIVEALRKYNYNLQENQFIHLDYTEKVKLGLLFFSMFKKCNYDVLSDGFAPFFVKKRNTFAGKITEKLVGTYLLTDWLKTSIHYLNDDLFEFQPILYKPKKWRDYTGGGYHHTPNPLNKRENEEYLKAANNNELQRLYKVLNTLQNSTFHIHKETFDVLDYFYKNDLPLKKNDGSDILPDYRRVDLPLTDEIIQAQEIVKIQKKMYKVFETNSKEIKLFNKTNKKELEIARKHAEATKRQIIKEISNKSKLKAFSTAIDGIARDFLEKDFYLPIQLDGRSRQYYKPSFNPQNNDLVRGLICAGKAEKISTDLESDELKEFFIQGANEYGEDKGTHSEKINFILNNMENILEAAENPLKEKAFWLNADKPILFLQFCFEFKKYLTAVGDEKEYFETRIFRYSDGKANGIQHLSAIARDENAGKLTAIIDEDTLLIDIYTKVAQKTNELIKESINSNGELKSGFTFDLDKYKELLKKWKKFKVDRKLAKSPVMTLSFNSTLDGRTGQILKYLNDRDINNQFVPFDYFEYKHAASILAKLIEHACHLIIPEIMDLINKMVEMVRVFTTYTKNKSLLIKTPYFNYPVVSKYHRKNSVAVNIQSKGVEFYLKTERETEEIDKRKLQSAIIPTIIQMLDPTHLFLTVEAMTEKNPNAEINYSMVHDSYGVSPKYSKQLNEAVRETFLKLYTDYCPFSLLKKSILESGREYYQSLYLELTETAQIDDDLDLLIHKTSSKNKAKITRIKKSYDKFVEELSGIEIVKGSLDITRVIYSNRFFD